MIATVLLTDRDTDALSDLIRHLSLNCTAIHTHQDQRSTPATTILLPACLLPAVPLIGGSQTVPAGVRRIGAVNATTAAPAADVSVAVLDTGVDLSNADLNVVAGINCDIAGTPPQDGNGHGTHCSGSIAAKNDAAGVIGVAPGTKIVAVKVSCGCAEAGAARVAVEAKASQTHRACHGFAWPPSSPMSD